MRQKNAHVQMANHIFVLAPEKNLSLIFILLKNEENKEGIIKILIRFSRDIFQNNTFLIRNPVLTNKFQLFYILRKYKI